MIKNYRLDKSIKMALSKIKISELTDIQKLAIPHILEKKHVFIKAETGSGKTYAYAIPII